MLFDPGGSGGTRWSGAFLRRDLPAATPARLLCACRCVGAADGEKAIARIRERGDPVGEYVGSQPYVGWQAAFDPLLEEGARNYWKSHDLAELSAGATGELLEAVQNLPGPDARFSLPILTDR
jgi:hypothetical protein